MNNPYLRDILSIELSCARTFTDKLLPEVLDIVNEAINDKLVESEFMALISDIWTNRTMFDFMGLAASLINSDFEREILVIGIMIMPGNHCAEMIQEAIESLVNKYDLDSLKIIGIFNFIIK